MVYDTARIINVSKRRLTYFTRSFLRFGKAYGRHIQSLWGQCGRYVASLLEKLIQKRSNLSTKNLGTYSKRSSVKFMSVLRRHNASTIKPLHRFWLTTRYHLPKYREKLSRSIAKLAHGLRKQSQELAAYRPFVQKHLRRSLLGMRRAKRWGRTNAALVLIYLFIFTACFELVNLLAQLINLSQPPVFLVTIIHYLFLMCALIGAYLFKAPIAQAIQGNGSLEDSAPQKDQAFKDKTDILSHPPTLSPVLEGFPGGIALWDHSLCLAGANEQFYTLYALPKKAAPLGTSYRDIALHTKALTSDPLGQDQMGQEPIYASDGHLEQYQVEMEGGRIHWVTHKKLPLKTYGHTMLTSTIDITNLMNDGKSKSATIERLEKKLNALQSILNKQTASVSLSPDVAFEKQQPQAQVLELTKKLADDFSKPIGRLVKLSSQLPTLLDTVPMNSIDLSAKKQVDQLLVHMREATERLKDLASSYLSTPTELSNNGYPQLSSFHLGDLLKQVTSLIIQTDGAPKISLSLSLMDNLSLYQREPIVRQALITILLHLSQEMRGQRSLSLGTKPTKNGFEILFKFPENCLEAHTLAPLLDQESEESSLKNWPPQFETEADIEIAAQLLNYLNAKVKVEQLTNNRLFMTIAIDHDCGDEKTEVSFSNISL